MEGRGIDGGMEGLEMSVSPKFPVSFTLIWFVCSSILIEKEEEVEEEEVIIGAKYHSMCLELLSIRGCQSHIRDVLTVSQF